MYTTAHPTTMFVIMASGPREGETGNGGGRHTGPLDGETGKGGGRVDDTTLVFYHMATPQPGEGETGSGSGTVNQI